LKQHTNATIRNFSEKDFRRGVIELNLELWIWLWQSVPFTTKM